MTTRPRCTHVTVIVHYEYGPYGQRQVFFSPGSNDPQAYATTYISQRVTVSSVDQPYGLCEFGHQGLFHDEDLGLIYNRARELHPKFGRFMQRDPMGYVDGMSMYEYQRSNVNKINDPFGLYGYYAPGYPLGGTPPWVGTDLVPLETQPTLRVIFGFDCSYYSHLGAQGREFRRQVAHAVNKFNVMQKKCPKHLRVKIQIDYDFRPKPGPKNGGRRYLDNDPPHPELIQGNSGGLKVLITRYDLIREGKTHTDLGWTVNGGIALRWGDALPHEMGHIVGWRDPDSGDWHATLPNNLMSAAASPVGETPDEQWCEKIHEYAKSQ